ncbi:MAG TPA: protein-glutamate O-methyltransferase [Caulobacteraceae bacterium]|nr:protein-glutamate O-methyltransferase [Caulobacteraceae bacterium]
MTSTSAVTGDVAAVAGAPSKEFAFTTEDFRQIAEILHGASGIALSENKSTLVYSRLAKRLRVLGLESFRDYCALVADNGNVDERQKMVAALTTNVTAFFREAHHFDHLRTKVLPQLLEKARQGGRVRLWSAACSTGMEPYSIALTILELAPNAADYDLRILATDIDPNVVAEGREGVYPDNVMQPVPDAMKSRWLEPVGQPGARRWRMGEALRQLVVFRELNLIGHWPMSGRFDVIFCRNVVIYFEESTQARIWGRFTQALQPGGMLYIGHSERLNGPATERFESDGLTTYRFKGASV